MAHQKGDRTDTHHKNQNLGDSQDHNFLVAAPALALAFAVALKVCALGRERVKYTKVAVVLGNQDGPRADFRRDRSQLGMNLTGAFGLQN